MLVSERCDHASALRSLDESLHDEIRLVHFLDGAGVLADSGGYGADAYRTSVELVNDGQQYLVVNLVKTILVDVERRERQPCYVAVDASVAFHLRKVAHTAQQGVGYSWRSA